MSILINRGSRVVVQGITGKAGAFFTRDMIKYGTKIVAGVTPGKGGIAVEGAPVFDSVREAVDREGAEVSIIFIPAPLARDSIFEAIDAGIKLVIYLGENMPVHDMMVIKRKLKEKSCRMIGPNTPGIISPGEAKIGFMPYFCYQKGPVGVVSRSGSLSYEVSFGLTRAGIGQSTSIGIGGDPVKGMDFVEALELFEKDPDTEAVVLIGEIGGTDEEMAAEYIKKQVSKPVVSFIAGKYAPLNKKMGHAGAIISGGRGTFTSKIDALREAGVLIANLPQEIPGLVKDVLGREKGG
ncbi:MAG: succinate--CoA ligase subunit alpha [Smithellaceae bacterium]|nr:succinate--CoA ligase subunit alpha [Smithellaceae bacterium]